MSGGRYRVAIVRSSAHSFGLAAFYERAFKQLGHDARCLSLIPPRRSIASRLGSVVEERLFPGCELRPRAIHAALQALRAFRPDFVLVSRCERLSAEAVQEICREARVGSALLYPDHPFVIPGPSVTCKSSFFSSFDIVLTFSKSLIPIFYQLGAKAVHWLPFAYDPGVHRPATTGGHEAVVFHANVAYLGSWGPLQEIWLNRLLDLGLKIYGGGWDRLGRRHQLSGGWMEGRGMGEEMRHAVAGSKIVFNLVRAEHGAFHSMKTFEIPACGGFMLANRTEEQEQFFRDRQEAVYFDTLEEARDYAQYYLDHERERCRIQENGMKAVRHHTYERRAEILLNYFFTGKWCMEI